jgi:hypothetical protein
VVVCCLAVALLATAPAAPPVGASALIRSRAGFAVGGGWISLTPAKLVHDLDAMQRARASWLRITVPWSTLEPTRGRYAWAADAPPPAVAHLDLVLRGAAARGIEVIAVVTTAPAWARPPGCTVAACAPADPADYAAFLRAAVARFSPAPYGVHVWEVWNMPNSRQYHRPDPDVARYAALLAASRPAIRETDPKATVLLGGLGAGHRACPKPSACIPALTFLRALYDAGAAGTFDGVDLHPVSEDAQQRTISPLAASPTNVFAHLADFHRTMVDHGDTGSIWGEVGYCARDGVTEAQQATWVGQALQRWVSWSWTAAIVVYNVRDLPGDQCGVLREGGAPKPAYQRFAALTA